jgi:nitroimidazol reductase NimA-like FMN-containing flavoprotein (pyridoxamine 5'-phosphate oxidase superfamily)
MVSMTSGTLPVSMRESPEELAELQAALDRSYESAGEHLKSICAPKFRMGAEAVAETLTGMCLLHLATATRAGEPIVGPVDGVFYRGRFVFGSSPNSVRFRHVRKRPSVSAAHTRGEELSVIVHGTAHILDTSTGEHDGLREVYREVYGKQYDSWGHWGNASYASIEPRKMFATRFDFGQS